MNEELVEEEDEAATECSEPDREDVFESTEPGRCSLFASLVCFTVCLSIFSRDSSSAFDSRETGETVVGTVLRLGEVAAGETICGACAGECCGCSGTLLMGEGNAPGKPAIMLGVKPAGKRVAKLE